MNIVPVPVAVSTILVTMLLAHRHGKLRRGEDLASARDIVAWNEDLITSYVFGLLRYLPAERGLSRLLRSVVPMIPIAGSIEVSAWPSQGGIEPDAVLLADAFTCVIEAKWDAPFGPLQLGREWQWLCAQPAKPHRALVVVTRYRTSATEVFNLLKRDLEALGAPELIPEAAQIGAITWASLAKLVLAGTPESTHEAAIVADLRWVFETCGVVSEPFEGWDLPVPALPAARSSSWYSGDARSYWTGLATAAPAAWRRPLASTSYFDWSIR